MLSRIEDNWKGQDQNWNMREQTFDSTNAAPSPFSCATSLQAAATIKLSFLDRGWTIANGQRTLWSQWKWIQPCPQVLREQAEWHQAILLHPKAREKEYIVNAFPHGRKRRHWDITLRYMQPYLEEKQLLQVAQWDKKVSAVFQHLGVLLERLGCINIICLVFLWRTVSEPGYGHILRLYPVQSFLISSCSTWTKVLIQYR